MALLNRVSRLLRADLHAVLDRVEEPEVLLRQAVREMDAALAEDRRRAKLMAHEQTRLDAQERDTARALERIGQELDLCFDAEQEDLARRLVRKRLERERTRDDLERRRAALGEAVAQLERAIRENQLRLDAMREKADLLAGEDAAAGAGNVAGADPAGPTITDEDVEIAFLGEKRRRSRS